MTSVIPVILSIDTEEDQWHATRDRGTAENLRGLDRLAPLWARTGARPTYFVSYVAATAGALADGLREAHRTGQGEVAAHLHPWNTPPLDEPLCDRFTMMANLPGPLQLAKLRTLTDVVSALRDGVPPTSFRAGRFGLGPGSVGLLANLGYSVDSSVTPHVSWAEYGGGPNFERAPLRCYRIAPETDPTVATPDGALVEVPLTVGFSRRPFARSAQIFRATGHAAVRPFGVRGAMVRSGLLRRIIGSPETDTAPDLLTLAKLALEEGAGYVHLFWHSPSLVAGLTPHTPREADVQRLIDRIAAFLDGVAALGTPEFVTVTELARRMGR